MADGLFLPDGSFQPFSATELSTELANRANAGVLCSELEGWLDILPDPDPVLRKRGDDARILSSLSADEQVATAMLSRKNRVLNCPHLSFRAGAPEGRKANNAAKLLFERFRQDLERCNLRSIISAMLDAPFYGFTPLELIWRYEDNWWHIIDIIAKPYYWFCFDFANEPVFTGEYCFLFGNQGKLPAGKFVFIQHHATYDNPYGLRLLSRCLWPVSFKRGGLSFYARFVERHGMPWVVGEAPAQATALEKQKMAASLSRMVQDAVAVIPHGSNVKLESPGQSQGEIHEKFLSRQDKAISKILMGQTLTVEMEGKNSQAAAQTHQDVAESLADADKAMVCDAWNEIAWLYCQVNSSKGTLAPVAYYDEPEDLNEQADLDKKLSELGVIFMEEHFTEVYGLKKGEFKVATSEIDGISDYAAANSKGKKASTHQAEKAQEALDKAITAMLPKALKSSSDFVGRVESAIRAAASYDDLQNALVELLSPSLTPHALEDFLACAMTAAAGYGSFAVNAEAGDAEQA